LASRIRSGLALIHAKGPPGSPNGHCERVIFILNIVDQPLAVLASLQAS
jgi:hypothetical protein